MLLTPSSCLGDRLSDNATTLVLPDHDKETFDRLYEYLSGQSIPLPWDNEDCIGLIQTYDLACFLGMKSAQTNIFKVIRQFVSHTRLNIHVINETAYIPSSCELRDFLHSRLFEELEHLYTSGQLKLIEDSVGSLWRRNDVIQAVTSVILRMQLSRSSARRWVSPSHNGSGRGALHGHSPLRYELLI
jgi:hypothetical protein